MNIKLFIGKSTFDFRDLKPENFLLKFENDEKSIKLIDFGLAKTYKEDEIMT